MLPRKLAFTLCLGLAVLFVSHAALAQYQLTNLVSNQVGWARHDDPLAVNAWGLAYGPGGPFWISDQGSGWSTLYDGKGNKKSLTVLIPTASGGYPGQPTGIVFSNPASGNFNVGGWPAIFLFATLDGTISGWTFKSNPNAAILAVNNSAAGSIFTGLAIAASGNFLYAADNWNNLVDVYDGGFNLVNSFTDPTVPAGFSVFGIQDINGLLYVAFAATNSGPGGVVDVFQEDGTFVKTLVSGNPLNQPWGLAAAPKNFGPLSNTLLVTNNINIDGSINGFNISTGQFVGTLKDTSGTQIHIDQLWGIEFGGGTANDGAANQLFFTAGPKNNLAGTFGVIEFAK